MKASEYAHRQLWFTPFPTEPVGWMIEQAGDDMFLFSSDYPHPEGGRDPLKRFESTMAGCSDEDRDRFYAGNFAEMMGMEVPAGCAPQCCDRCRAARGVQGARPSPCVRRARRRADAVRPRRRRGQGRAARGRRHPHVRPQVAADAGYFRQQNAGKRSITVDLTTARGRGAGAAAGDRRRHRAWRTSGPA